MEAAAPTTPTPAPTAPATAPIAEVSAAAPPQMPPSPYESAPIMADGGSVSSGGGFFKSLNWLEVGFGILGVAALLYAIQYYRFKVKEDKMVNNELQRQMDEIKMNLQSSMKGKYKTI